MFRLSRNRPAKSGDRVEFRFSNFKALQVPKGWDKLFVSIVSVETGKTITKSSKALVRNGSCEWTDTLSESIISPQNESSKEVEDCLFKFVVAMGSARSGILGETTINMTGYMSSTASVSVSLPLKKNNYGTVLQVTIHCMAQTTKVRDGESKESNEDLKADCHGTDAKSEVSDSISPQSVTSSSSKDRLSATASHPGEPESRQTSFSASGSHDSYDSVDIFLSREALSPTITNISGNGHNLRQDSSTSHGNHLADDASQTHHSSFTSPTSLLISTSSKNLLEAAEDAIEELRAEAKMWERNARKLMLDLDMLRKEFLDQSKDQANLEMELSATQAECEGLRKEVERLKLLPEKSAMASSLDDSASHLRKELENEIKIQRESSADLAMQFKRSQESNIELVSLLQELELEKSVVQSKADDLEKSLHEKMQQVEELEKNLQAKVLMLERALEDKTHMTEAKLSEPISSDGGDANLIMEMEAMKEKVQELERDCNELTDENLELLFKLKELNNNSTGLCSSCSNLNTKLHNEIDDGHDVSIQELKSKIAEMGKELDNRRSVIAKLEADLMSKEEGIAELEAKVADLEKQNINLEENMKAVAKESEITSKCMNGLQKDLVMLRSSVGNHVSANKMLERKSSELETGRNELQLRLLELEEENVQLTDCISGLEAQLRHLTDESESSRLELDHFKSLVQNQQDEMEIQNADLKQKCEYQRRTNQEMQETAEKLSEECDSLQKLNGELREQNLQLEAKLRESSKSFSECSEKVVILEENLSSALEDFAAKEKTLTSELDALLEENRKLVTQETLFNEMYLEKSVEADNLHEEVQHLTEKVSSAYDERDRTISKALEERGELEAYVQEIESKLEHTENELNELRAELSVSKQNHEKVLNLLEDYRSSEENFKNAVSNLELKLTVSEYERQKLLAETNNLKGRVEKMALLHDEVLAYKNELAATIFDKEKLEDSLHRVSGELEELKTENTSLVGELEDCKCSRVALEEKLLQVEHHLMEKEADLRNELNRISRTNSQLQRKIQQLEKDKEECLIKNHTLEDELKSMKEERQNQRVTKTNAKVSPVREDMKFPKNEMAKSPKSPIHNRDSRRKSSSKNDQVQEITRNRQKPHNIDHHKEGSNGSSLHDQHPQSVNLDSCSKIQLLENELANAMEANKTFKAQLNRLMSEGQSQRGEVVAKERFERTKSSLETELKDIRERYLHMSLQYAEVEAQREELVMKLRAAKNGKRWFS